MGIKKIDDSKALDISKKKRFAALNVFVDLCEKHGLAYWLDSGTLLGAVRHRGMIPWDDDVDVCLPAGDYVKMLQVLLEFSKKEDNPYLIFFYGSDFCSYNDFFGDSTILADGVYPIQIDIACAKYVKNTPEAIATDNSWANVASLYFKGRAKHPEMILPEHHHLLPKGEDLLKERSEFAKAYMEYMLASMALPEKEKPEDLLLYFASNDFLIRKDRPHFKYSSVFPLKTIEFENKIYRCPYDTDEYLANMYGNYMELPPENERKNRMSFIMNADIDKWKWRKFLIDFHKSGYLNFALTASNKKIMRPLIKIKTFSKLMTKALLQGNFDMAKGLVLYSLNKMSKS